MQSIFGRTLTLVVLMVLTMQSMSYRTLTLVVLMVLTIQSMSDRTLTLVVLMVLTMQSMSDTTLTFHILGYPLKLYFQIPCVFDVFSLSDRKFSLCQFTSFVSITYT